MRGVAWILLFCAVLACANTAYAQKADGSISVSDKLKLIKNYIKPGTGLRRNLVKNSQLETPEPKTPEPETAQPKAPEPKAPETENTTSSTTPTPPVAKQEGPTVTGSYTKAVIWEGNRFDPSIAAVPSGFGNEQSDLKEVAILDSWTEFATDFGSGAIEKLDISTNGLITLDVSYPTNTMYEEGAYTLGSAWFTKYKAAKLVSSNGLPTDVSVTVSGASDLAAGVLKINIPTFNLLEGTVGFQLQFRLVECEPGEDAPCCDPETNTVLNGTVCRKGLGDCEADTKCNGVDPGCPITYADGKKCPYYPLDEIIDRFKPFNPKGWPALAMAAEPSYGDHSHPPCTGRCDTGKCNLDKSHPGCCTVGPWKYIAAEAQKATGSGEIVKAMAAEYEEEKPKGDVYCWEGTEDSDGYVKSSKGASQAPPRAGAVKN